MKRTALSLLAGFGLGLGFVAAGAGAQAQPVFQITNDTLSAGDPNFPVISDITFQSLILTDFTGGAVTTLNMYDPTDTTRTATNMLDTSGNGLESDAVVVPTGGFSNVTLNGTLDLTTFQAQFAPGGFVGTYGPYARLFADFNNSIAGPGSFALGTLSLFNTTTNTVMQSVRIYAVPEPGSLALFVSSGLGLTALLRRRCKNSA